MPRVGGLLGNHVHMALEDHSPAVFIAGGRRDPQDDIAGFVAEGLYPAFDTPVIKIFLDFAFMLGGTWNLRQGVEILPDDSRS